MNRRPNRVLFVNRFFWPDHSATAQMLSDAAFDLAQRGWSVEVIASRLSYDDPQVRLPALERERGVTIRRVATTSFGRERLVGRAIDYASFYLTATWAAFRHLRRGDVLVVKTDPPMLGVPMAMVSALRGAQQVNWLQDVYPELAAALGVKLGAGGPGRALAWVRNLSLRRSARTVTIGERMAERVVAAGVPAGQVRVLHNWTDETAITPLPASENPLRREWGLSRDTLVVGYSGNLGRAHEIDTVAAVARRLADEGRRDIVFLFVGGGHLKQSVAALGLPNIVFQPYQPRERLPLSMTVPDIQWLSLQPALEGLIVPSKFYSAAASGRPVVFVGDPDGEIARMVAQEDCGWVIRPGDADKLHALLVRIAGDRHDAEAKGARARRLVAETLGRGRAVDQWEALLGELMAPPVSAD